MRWLFKAYRDSFIRLGFLLPVAIILGWHPHVPMASVPPKMEQPEFWIKKIESPDRLLMTSEQIEIMNKKNLSNQDLLLCRVKDLKEEWTREEVLALMKEDLETFQEGGKLRYGRNGLPLDEIFWNALKEKMNPETLREKNRIPFGLIVNRTDVRVFPTDEPCRNNPAGDEFDRFQHSSVSPGSLVGIYSMSRDKEWAYVQTGFVRGWVRTMGLALAKEKKEAIAFEENPDRLVMTGSFVKVFSDPSLQQIAFLAQMGASFPMLAPPSNAKTNRPSYTIQIPFREADGQLISRQGYIRGNEDVHRGFLPYTRRNVALQAFKMLHQPYGWGEMLGGRDCSRFVMDLFGAFGILLPRNSKQQSRVGIPPSPIEPKTIKEKMEALNRAVPLATLLHFPGHIMLYLGKHERNYYAIHSIWGIQRSEKSGPAVERIGKTVVSDLSLGSSGPKGSLLDRITDIRMILPK